MGEGAVLNRPRRALLSVTDKSGLASFAAGLTELGYELLASGGTAAHLREHGLPVRDVSEVTGFPEVFGGRVKTLHPTLFAGILAPDEASFAAVGDAPVLPLDMVVVNLYAFREAVRAGADAATAVEQIDIGGPSLLRAAAKNFARVAVVPAPDFYAEVLAACREHGGFPPPALRRRLAAAAFALTRDYDTAIAAWFAGAPLPEPEREVPLRYGENPHQEAVLRVPDAGAEQPLAGIGLRQHHGKQLSYNNVVDVVAALKLVDDLPAPACAAIKHTNPCGAGTGETAAAALEAALRADPEATFGGIFAFNTPLDNAAAQVLRRRFCEVIVAPAFPGETLAALSRKKNLRLLTWEPERFRAAAAGQERAFGALRLRQEEDHGFPELDTAAVVAGPPPAPAVRAALELAWRCCKHVKSNAVVLGDARGLLGVGAGQMSRVDAVRLALDKARRRGLATAGAVAASDAFFPFPDSLELLHAAGVAAVIAPRGSLRDPEVIAAAQAMGLTLLHVDRRHFRH